MRKALVSFIALVALTGVALAQFTDQRTWGGTSGGSANAQTISIANYTTYTAGIPLRFIAGFSNTAATTLNVSGIGTRNVYRVTEDEVIPLVGGEVVTGAVVEVVYDGAQFILQGKQVPIGTSLDMTGVAAPPGYVLAGAQALTRSAPYDALFRKVTIRQTGTTVSGTPQITALSDTSSMAFGMPVCGTGIATNSTILTVDSGTQITLSLNTTGSASVTVTVAPWGCGDGTTTFNIPDGRGRAFAGRDNMITAASRLTTAGTACSGLTVGVGCGAQTVTLVAGNIPQLTSSSIGNIGSTAVAVNLGTAATVVAGPTSGTVTVGSVSPSAVNKVQPTAVVNKIIKY